MNQPGTYSWLPAYMSAVLETDNALIPPRICEALAAIEQRFLNPIEASGIEYREIKHAQTGLLTLKAERVGDGSVSDGTSVTRAEQHSEGTS